MYQEEHEIGGLLKDDQLIVLANEIREIIKLAEPE